jgi:hypothetical protein
MLDTKKDGLLDHPQEPEDGKRSQKRFSKTCEQHLCRMKYRVISHNEKDESQAKVEDLHVRTIDVR